MSVQSLHCDNAVQSQCECLQVGMLPLSATLATNSCFEAFQHDSKLKALLHGHSYTAHAIGCGAANTALDMYTDPGCNSNVETCLTGNQSEVTQLRNCGMTVLWTN